MGFCNKHFRIGQTEAGCIACNQKAAIVGLIEAVKGTDAWDNHDGNCELTEWGGVACGCGHEVLHAAVEAGEEAKK